MLQENMRGPIHQITTTDGLWRPRADPGALSRPKGAKGGGRATIHDINGLFESFCTRETQQTIMGQVHFVGRGKGGQRWAKVRPTGVRQKWFAWGPGVCCAKL